MTEIDPKLSQIYREVSTESPPAALDAAILAAARKHAAQPRRRERPSWLRWMAPASALATLALGVSIALLVEREQPGTLDETAIRAMPPRPQGAPASAPVSAKANAADSAAPMKKEAPAIAEPAQAPVSAAPTQAPEPQPAASATGAGEAFPADSRAKAAGSTVTAPKAAAEANVARDAAVGGPSAGAPAAPAAAGKVAPLRQQAMHRSAEAWLDEIARLQREGHDKEAAEQLAEFRKAYPDHAVPESLRILQQ